MRVSIASLLAYVCLGAATLATDSVAVVHALAPAQAQADNGTTTNATAASDPVPVFNLDDVVEEIIMGDRRTDGPVLLRQVSAGDFNNDPGVPQRPEISHPFIETIHVRRPFDDLIVTTPNVGPIEIIKVKNGKKTKTKRRPLRPSRDEFVYGEFMILRLRSIANQLVTSIRASAEQPEELAVVLTHTMSNTKVSSRSTTTGWEAEATITARAEASIGRFGLGASASRELSGTVRGSVSTTFASSQAKTVEVSKETSFTLRASAGKEAALWMSTMQLDVYVCKSRTDKVRTNPINGACHFSHSVVEDGKRYEITVTNLVQ